MMHENFLKLMEIITSTDSIKLHADEIFELRTSLEEFLTDEEKIILSSRIKDKVQDEADQEILNSGTTWAAIYMATGSGKSKIAVNRSHNILLTRPDARILIVVPTEKLRDENWKEEFDKWGYIDDWNKIERCCYASLSKYEDNHFSLVILDEGHNITENNSIFFKKNIVYRCILLTATRPKDLTKIQILQNLGIKSVYELSLDEAVKLGLVAPYDIVIITMYLDNVDKYIECKSKKGVFYQTEKAYYNYLSRSTFGRPSKMGFIKRMWFIYSLKSKTETAKLILEHVIPKNLKTLIFAGGRKQASELCDRTFFSKPTPPKKLANPTAARVKKFQQDYEKYAEMMKSYEGDAGLSDFKNNIINRLACVDALNEGQNIDGVDVGFVVQLNRNEKDFLQRLGRFIRYRPGHRGMMIILSVEDSIEKEWVKQAIKGCDPDNITTIELSRLRLGLETINF